MPLPKGLLALMGPWSLVWAGVEPSAPRLTAWAPDLAMKPGYKTHYKTHCIPLALHGDGVPVFKGKSLYVISGVSLLGIGTSIDVKILITRYWYHLKSVLMHWAVMRQWAVMHHAALCSGQ